MVVTGIRDSSTTRMPYGESRLTTPRAARSGWNKRDLRLEVLLHVGVVVEMVVAEVGERGHVEDEPVHPVAGQRLRAHLDRDGADPALPHPGQQGVHLARLGRGQAAHDREVADVALGGRGQPGDQPELLEDRLEQVRGRWSCRSCRSWRTAARCPRRCGRPRPTARRAPRAVTGRPGSGGRCRRRVRRRRHRSGSRPRRRPGPRAAKLAPWARAPAMPTYRSPGCRSPVLSVMPLTSIAVDRPAHLDAELVHQPGQGPRHRMLGAQHRGNASTH